MEWNAVAPTSGPITVCTPPSSVMTRKSTDIGMEISDEIHRFSTIGCLATNKEVWGGIERHPDERSDVRLVVYNKHPDRSSSTLGTHRQPRPWYSPC